MPAVAVLRLGLSVQICVHKAHVQTEKMLLTTKKCAVTEKMTIAKMIE